jgi:hypothetical protein
MILKEVIKYSNANAIEATWANQTIVPAVGIEGKEDYKPETIIEKDVIVNAYADTQMQMFRNDVSEYGGDISQYESLIAEVEAGIVPPPLPTPEEVEKEIVSFTQIRLDSFAKTRNYDTILSACTYATSPTNKFKLEGSYCVDARDATWAKLYEILAEVQSGTRPMPLNYEEIESELPVLEWPL